MGKYTNIIKEAKNQEPENRKDGKAEISKEVNTEIQLDGNEEGEEVVSLCIKVPIQQRRYWTAKAKEEGTTIKAVVIEGLTKRFGEPKR